MLFDCIDNLVNEDLWCSLSEIEDDLEDIKHDRAKCGVSQIVSMIFPHQRLVSVVSQSVSSQIKAKDIPGNETRLWEYELNNQIENDVDDFNWELWYQAPQVWG